MRSQIDVNEDDFYRRLYIKWHYIRAITLRDVKGPSTAIDNRQPNVLMKEKLEYKPPWFTLQVIGIAGASASGKTSVAKALVKKLNVALILLNQI